MGYLRACCQPGSAFFVFAPLPQKVSLVTPFRFIRLVFAPCLPTGGTASGVDERDAVDRAHRDAQLAARAHRIDDGVHVLCAAHDGVYRTGFEAQRAPDAPRLVDHREQSRAFLAAGGVKRQGRATGELGKPNDALLAARRAPVDLRFTARHGFGIGSAIGVSAARALRLRQSVVQRVGKGCGAHPASLVRRPAVALRAEGLPGVAFEEAETWCLAMN